MTDLNTYFQKHGLCAENINRIKKQYMSLPRAASAFLRYDWTQLLVCDKLF